MPNCTLSFECGKNWSELAETSDPAIGFCQDCRKNVYQTKDDDELAVAVALKRCVAVKNSPDDQWEIGDPSMPGDPGWLEHQAVPVSIRLVMGVSAARLETLRLELPAAFDGANVERSLLDGRTVDLGPLPRSAARILIAELDRNAPELDGTLNED